MTPRTTPRPPYRSAATPEEAFDGLHAHAAPALIHQIRVLTGRPGFAFEAVEHAFHQAWERWPEVAVDPDPVGWLRATACAYALSPWHRFRPAHARPAPLPDDPVLAALLRLPPARRRAVLLCDGLGLSVHRAAEETEATVAATAARLRHGRAALRERLPGLGGPGELREAVAERVAAGATATVPSARSVRRGGERRVRLLTRTVCAATAALAALVTVTAATTPARQELRPARDTARPAGLAQPAQERPGGG